MDGAALLAFRAWCGMVWHGIAPTHRLGIIRYKIEKGVCVYVGLVIRTWSLVCVLPLVFPTFLCFVLVY